MLSQLLNLFFIKQDPEQAITVRLNEYWSDWLQPISNEKPTGDDLTYHDSFQEIKEEISKLSNIDYSLIINESETIIKHYSKDIRVVTYYCLARLQVDGLDGFADGLELLGGLLNKFGLSLYPSRSNIRKNAIEWLANAKFTDVLNKLQPIPETSLSRIVAALNLIEKCNQKLFTNEDSSQPSLTPDLDALIRFFANGVKQPNKASSSASLQQEQPQQAPSLEVSKEVDNAIHSQHDLLAQARRMAMFLREKPSGYLAAGRFLRVLRWDIIDELPPADTQGKTKLPAPRAELKQNINHLIKKQEWHELFNKVEAIFMEGANHFWFDLQRAAVLALQKMGDPYHNWATTYLTDVGLVLERLQGIERLTYDNGTPFADDETINWITTMVKGRNSNEETPLASTLVSSDDDWNEITTQARELANNEGLEVAFKWLQNLPIIRSTKNHYFLQYTQAIIAEQNGKTDIAVKLLTGLNNKQNIINLLEWEPALIFDVKCHLLRLLKQKIQLKESNKEQLMIDIERLNHDLILLDPARSLTIIE